MSRRLLKAAGLLALLLAAVLVNSAVRGDESPLELNPVAAAAAKAEDSAGFDFNLYIVYNSPALPRPISAHGGGSYDLETDRTRMTISVDASPVGPIRFLQISDSTYDYEKSNAFSGVLPPGKEWVRTEKDEDDDTPDVDFDELTRMLEESGDVKVAGHQSVNGKMTRRYSATLTIAELVELLREQGDDGAADAYEGIEGLAPTAIRTEVWIDRKNLPRRMRIVMPSPGEDGEPPMTMDIRMDLFNFGAHPDIQLPNPDTVVDGPLDSPAAPAPASAS